MGHHSHLEHAPVFHLPDLAACWLRYLRQVTSPLWASSSISLPDDEERDEAGSWR